MSHKRIVFSGSNGIEIVGHIAGPDIGATVLLAHGGGQTKRAWAKTLEQLAAAGYRAVAIDLRGHGESQWAPDGTYETADFAADLLCVADQLQVRPHLVGASLGGLSGLVAEGMLRLGSLASLTLVDIAPNVAPAGVERVVGFMQKHVEAGFASPEEAAEVIAAYTPNRAKRGPVMGSSAICGLARMAAIVGTGTQPSLPAFRRAAAEVMIVRRGWMRRWRPYGSRSIWCAAPPVTF
jgi:pimeloyl-ACP methyl ester carboxylesterase